MFKSLRFVAFFSCLALAAGPAPAQESYPERPVTLLVGYAAGGGMDATARIVAERLGKALGEEVLVSNQPGASGTLAAANAKKAEPDGYTLFLAETGTFVGPVLYPHAAYDPVADFDVVVRTGDTAMALAVPATSSIETLKDVVARARAEPGKLDYGTPGVGTLHFLAFEWMKKLNKLDIVHVPYKGGAPTITALLSGEIPMGMASLPAALPQAEGGKLRLIALTGTERSEFAPEIPLFSELVPGFDAPSGIYLLAPKGTPPEVLAVLHEAMRETLADEGVRNAFAKNATSIEEVEEGEDFSELYARTVRAWSQIARDIGVKPKS